MKKRRRAFFVVWLLFLALFLSFTTYAWFSTNRLLIINTFDLHVASKGGIEISADGMDWKGVLALTDIINARETYPGSINQIPSRIEPVSTGGEIENGLLKMYFGETNILPSGGFYLYASRSIEEEGFGEDSEGTFVAFDIFLKVISPKTLYLVPQSGVSYEGDVSKGIENAFRIAFLVEGNSSEETPTNIIQGHKSATKAHIWEPNYDEHTDYGVSHALNIYNIVTTNNNGALLPYDGIVNDISDNLQMRVDRATASNYPTHFKKVNVDIATKKSNNEFPKLFDLNTGITKVRVYIWVEGQDVDCEDNASIADVLVNLQFTTEPL